MAMGVLLVLGGVGAIVISDLNWCLIRSIRNHGGDERDCHGFGPDDHLYGLIRNTPCQRKEIKIDRIRKRLILN